MYESSPSHDPVFVDRSGRRRRFFALTGTAGGLLLVLAVVALLAGFTGVGPAHVPGWPAADRVARPTPSPARSASPPATHVPAAPAHAGLPPRSATSAAATTPAAVATTTAPPASPSPTGNSHRRVPTHTPNPHASKKL